MVGDNGANGRPKSKAELQEAAWTMLHNAMNDAKHSDLRVQGLAALGLMGSTPRSVALIEKATGDPDVDVRTASLLSAGQSRAPELSTALRRLLDDKQPQVAFTAALTLWKLNDESGEDILLAVAQGERSASAGLMDGAKHTISKDLHHPSTLAMIGVEQGAGFLGPFGIGVGAYEYLRKNGGNSARAQAIDALARERTEPIRRELVAALTDRDFAVRTAAAKGLAQFHDAEAELAMTKLFEDSKAPVRLTAAASYLISTGGAQASPDPEAKPLMVAKPRAARAK